jgi:hypothetical protein
MRKTWFEILAILRFVYSVSKIKELNYKNEKYGMERDFFVN